jgi:hypothetical protein
MGAPCPACASPLTPKKDPGDQCKRGRPGYESSNADGLFRFQVAFERAIYDDEVVKAEKFIALKLSSGNSFSSLAIFCRSVSDVWRF